MLNILIIGVGQCGNRILDAINKEAFGGGLLSKYYGKQKFTSHVETIAINTAVNDLKELRFTKAKDRIHVPYLHGVGANRPVGKKCLKITKNCFFALSRNAVILMWLLLWHQHPGALVRHFADPYRRNERTV